MKHWEILNTHNGYAHIGSPSMAENDPELLKNFKERRGLKQGLIDLENDLREQGAKGWFTWTLITRPHVMRLLFKLGAKPYNMTLKQPEGDVIWFNKPL